jgi:hypothetical protein
MEIRVTTWFQPSPRVRPQRLGRLTVVVLPILVILTRSIGAFSTGSMTKQVTGAIPITEGSFTGQGSGVGAITGTFCLVYRGERHGEVDPIDPLREARRAGRVQVDRQCALSSGRLGN